MNHCKAALTQRHGPAHDEAVLAAYLAVGPDVQWRVGNVLEQVLVQQDVVLSRRIDVATPHGALQR